jgi:DNA-binding GntR family transcriptional regulator
VGWTDDGGTATEAKPAPDPDVSEPGQAPSRVASQRIADVIKQRILDGTWPPGTRIKQDELAEELQASRIPVREGLRIIESLGLITVRANSGAWVTEMTLHDLEMSYRIRERIEPMLLLDSMPHLGATVVQQMRKIQRQIEADPGVERFLVLDREFHWLSYGGNRTPQLEAMVQRLWDTTAHYRRLFTRIAYTQGAGTIYAEHHLLIDAIESGDTGIAESVLTLHIQRTRHELSRHAELFESIP